MSQLNPVIAKLLALIVTHPVETLVLVVVLALVLVGMLSRRPAGEVVICQSWDKQGRPNVDPRRVH